MAITIGGPWIAAHGPDTDVVLSCRARIARNIAGFPFVNQASESECREIMRLSRRVVDESGAVPSIMWIDVETTDEINRGLLVERHLISGQLAEAEGCRGVAVSRDESLSIMVNEEDHLRMQVLAAGSQLPALHARLDGIDDAIEKHLDYAFDKRFGYLTACPTNAGTGVRFSVMMHLPALKITGDIERVRRAAGDMHLAVRGYYGEGSESAGDFYQVSNQVTLGVSEEDILHELSEVIVPRMIEYERSARRHLLDRNRREVEDRVFRALGILRTARLLEPNETMKLLSRVRLGAWLGLIEDVSRDTINRLFLDIQPAHVRLWMDAQGNPDTSPPVRSRLRSARADLVRERLATG